MRTTGQYRTGRERYLPSPIELVLLGVMLVFTWQMYGGTENSAVAGLSSAVVVALAWVVGLGLRVALKNSIPVVASYQTDVSGFARRWKMGVVSEPVFQFYKFIHNRADINLVPSNFTRKQLVAKGFKRLTVWPGGVETDPLPLDLLPVALLCGDDNLVATPPQFQSQGEVGVEVPQGTECCQDDARHRFCGGPQLRVRPSSRCNLIHSRRKNSSHRPRDTEQCPSSPGQETAVWSARKVGKTLFSHRT